MKKSCSIVCMIQGFIMALVFLFPVTAHSQNMTAEEKTTLCQQEKRNLSKLNAQLGMIAFQIPFLKKSVSEMAIYQQQAFKYDDKRIDLNIKNCLTSQKTLKQNIADAFAGSMDEVRYKYQLEDVNSRLDYVTEIKTKRLIGETADLKDNAIQKKIQQFKTEIDQLEESQKYLKNDLVMNKRRISRLRCDDITATVSNIEEYIKKLVGGWTDKPTPWGTPGGPCQIKYANGKMTLVNENKDESDATVTVNSDGTARINAGKWPVSGTVNKAGNSIIWSNKSEWIR